MAALTPGEGWGGAASWGSRGLAGTGALGLPRPSLTLIWCSIFLSKRNSRSASSRRLLACRTHAPSGGSSDASNAL